MKAIKDQLKLRATVFRLCIIKGYTQKAAAETVGLSNQRISQILSETTEEWLERVKERSSPEALIARKLEQYQDIRQEAWEAWEKSKEDAVCTTEERRLRIVYRDTVIDGKTVRLPVAEKLTLVKSIKRVESRLPASEFLTTVLKCLAEESRLQGLTEGVVVSIVNSNVGGNQASVVVNWDAMTERPRIPDEVEAKSAAALPPPDSSWTEAEVAELDDEPEHVNGNGHAH